MPHFPKNALTLSGPEIPAQSPKDELKMSEGPPARSRDPGGPSTSSETYEFLSGSKNVRYKINLAFST